MCTVDKQPTNYNNYKTFSFKSLSHTTGLSFSPSAHSRFVVFSLARYVATCTTLLWNQSFFVSCVHFDCLARAFDSCMYRSPLFVLLYLCQCTCRDCVEWLAELVEPHTRQWSPLDKCAELPIVSFPVRPRLPRWSPLMHLIGPLMGHHTAPRQRSCAAVHNSVRSRIVIVCACCLAVSCDRLNYWNGDHGHMECSERLPY